MHQIYKINSILIATRCNFVILFKERNKIKERKKSFKKSEVSNIIVLQCLLLNHQEEVRTVYECIFL